MPEVVQARIVPSYPVHSRSIDGYLETKANHSIWIGATRQQLIQKLGNPSGRRKDWLIFLYQGKVKGKPQSPGAQAVVGDETGLLEARVVNGVVVALNATKVITYYSTFAVTIGIDGIEVPPRAS